MRRLLLALVGLLALAACSMAPITIDVLPMLGDDASGSRQIASAGPVEMLLPGPDGRQVSGYEVPPIRPATVALDYALDLQRDGQMEGDVTVTFYLAASESDLWKAESQLGEPLAVSLAETAQTLSGTLELNGAQIDALMSGNMVIGAKLTGTATGQATISYEFTKLLLKVTFI
ncbi:MAG TPA: hypothetical protein ENK37_02065 [Oceanithermus profundus]|uniref:Lipoprotein n=1 Tax=Oceanithermus profundus TaxID=187137 RepID=A0A7C4V4S7_9DEIN|nr:hypothetical protein [Oceanithermus profundus]